jgi:hypothetical protein
MGEQMKSIIAGAAAVCLVISARAAEPACDRACLEGFVDQYLAALVAQDPSKLALAKNARYTENGQELKLGRRHVGTNRYARNLQVVFRRSAGWASGLLRNHRRAWASRDPGAASKD